MHRNRRQEFIKGKTAVKCYYHNDVEAVVVCNECSRALCADCATIEDDRAVCKNKCWSDGDYAGENYGGLERRGGRGGARANLINAALGLLAALVMALLGFRAMGKHSDTSSFYLMILAVMCLVWAISSYLSGRKREE